MVPNQLAVEWEEGYHRRRNEQERLQKEGLELEKLVTNARSRGPPRGLPPMVMPWRRADGWRKQVS